MKLLLIADHFDRSALYEPAWWMAQVVAHALDLGWQVEGVCRDPRGVAPAGVVVHPHGALGFESALSEALASRPSLVYLVSPGPFTSRMVDAIGHTPLVVDVMTHWPVCPNDNLMRRPAFQRCDLRYPADACGPCAGFERMRDMQTRLRLVRGAAVVIAHARFQAERLAGLLARPIECVTVGVDTERFHPNPAAPAGELARRLWDSRGRNPRVVLLGPPTHERGMGVLVDVMVGTKARVPGVEFVIAGDDLTNPGWQLAMMTELGGLGLAAQVSIAGCVEPADWPAVIASSDVGIAPALWDDPSGLFVLQAFGCGVPVVASGRGVHAELLQYGSGMLASPQSPAIFADRVALLLLHHEARRAMGDAARLHAVERHDLACRLASIEEIVLRAAGETQRAA